MRWTALATLGLMACEPMPVEVGEEAPTFALEDVNPTSPSFGDTVGHGGPGTTTLVYFGHANCPYCRAQYEVLDDLLLPVLAAGTPLEIYGVNLSSLADENEAMVSSIDLPWLQDDGSVWEAYGAEWRDLFLVDEDGTVTWKRNLTSFDLQDPVNLQVLVTELQDQVELQGLAE